MSPSLRTVFFNYYPGTVFLWTYIYTITTVLCVCYTYTLVVCVMLNSTWRIWQCYLQLLLTDFIERIYDLLYVLCLCLHHLLIWTRSNRCSEPLLLQLQQTPLSQQVLRSSSTLDESGFTSYIGNSPLGICCSFYLLSLCHILACGLLTVSLVLPLPRMIQLSVVIVPNKWFLLL